MSQNAKFIDITRSFIPVDPNTFPSTLHGTTAEDAPEDAARVVAYKGYNFLPTSYGYKSFFGTAASLGINALTSRVDRIFILQTNTFANLLIALCEDGIWTKAGEAAGAWIQAITLPIPPAGTKQEWSYCTLGTNLYMYRSGSSKLYRLSSSPSNIELESYVAPITVGSLSAVAMVGGLAAGTYEYKLAAFSASGQLSSPVDFSTITISNPSSIKLSFTKPASLTKFRVYRIFAGVTKYFDVTLGSDTAANIYDAANEATEVTLPDTTWVTAVTSFEYLVQEETPTFLNMAGQQGIFKAGMRLGFWDSANSVAWSSIDDLSEFTPSVQTLAGSAVFGDVVGRIVNILPHGEGFIIYATKSIVYVRRNVEATFQWDPTVVLSDAGVAFVEEACSATPDTVHFAWTTAGLYKIEEGRAEIIVPEVYDYLKEMEYPLYLQVLEGRYLCLQLIDPVYAAGQVQFTANEIPTTTITFPANNTVEDLADPLTLTGNDVCYTMQGWEDANSKDGSGAGAAAAGAGKPPKDPDTMYTPLYRVHLSFGNAIDPGRITWGPTPCATVGPDGVEYALSPVGNFGKVTRLTQDTTNKAIYTDDPASPGTRWTIEKFVATQLAIWGKEDEVRSSFLQAIVNRAAQAEGNIVIQNHDVPIDGQSGLGLYSCPATPAPSVDYCALGDFIVEMSAPHMGMNSCSFWLTRYATKKAAIKRVKSVQASCQVEYVEDFWTDVGNLITGKYATPEAVCIARKELVWPNNDFLSYEPISPYEGKCWYAGTPDNFVGGYPDHWHSSRKTTKDVMNAFNSMEAVQEGIWGTETAWIELIGWAYTDINGQSQVVYKAGSCARPAAPATPPDTPSSGSGGTPNTGNAPADNNGTMCGIPFTPVTLPAIQDDAIVWPTQTITLPGSSFLLQEGSVGPIYPTFEGALVYDLHLKKWGKLRTKYRRLLDYSPINSTSGGIIPYSTFGMKSGAIKEDGKVYLFDQYPSDSRITYGKIGYYRLGFTNLEELNVNFARPFTGYVVADASLDGKSIEPALTKSAAVNNSLQASVGVNSSARWFNVSIQGQFDLTHVEFRGVKSSRR